MKPQPPQREKYRVYKCASGRCDNFEELLFEIEDLKRNGIDLNKVSFELSYGTQTSLAGSAPQYVIVNSDVDEAETDFRYEAAVKRYQSQLEEYRKKLAEEYEKEFGK